MNQVTPPDTTYKSPCGCVITLRRGPRGKFRRTEFCVKHALGKRSRFEVKRIKETALESLRIRYS